MQFFKFRTRKDKAALLWIVFAVLSLPILLSCGDNQESADIASLPANEESFTFFDIGKHTKLNESVRSALADKLGNDAIQRRNTIDLEINFDGFLKQYFPNLDELNRKLNFPPRERVEHNTVKLMYRYAQRIEVPFDLVELVFSGYNQNPILFRIYFKADEANTVKALQEKYGPPKLIDWQKDGGRSLFWQKTGDTLILNFIPNQFGNYDHQIVIYYVENLKRLIDTERKEKEARELERTKAGEKVF